MKSKTDQFEKNRARKDYIFRAIVTLFGLLVLAVFATLVLHILSNAMPLLASPKAENTHKVKSALAGSNIGTLKLGGKAIYVSTQECSLVLSTLASYKADSIDDSGLTTDHQKVEILKQFAPDCSKKVIALAGEQNQYVLMLHDRVLEIYYLDTLYALTLKSSLALPEQFTAASINTWQVSLIQNTLFIQRNVNKEFAANSAHKALASALSEPSILTLTHHLSSLDAPIVREYKNALHVLALTKFSQVLVATHTELLMYNMDMDIIQRFTLADNDINKDFITAFNDQPTADVTISALSQSPSFLDIFVRISMHQKNKKDGYVSAKSSDSANNKVILKKFTLVNQSGQFLLRETLSLPMAPEFGLAKLLTAFDLRHNAGLFVDEFGAFALMNTVTGEIKHSANLSGPIQNIHYSQGHLLLTYKDGFARYLINDLQGMTSMQILFGKNDYAGYANKAYIWQTSVSSATQSPKYSVVPLIMGSLKASILALVVALPLALGAAIYTAYFASPKLRNLIKPSIEMLEAIPSVVIGFIAAIWLAPFAEQYLLSIVTVIILLPFVILSIAALHGYLQTKSVFHLLRSWQLPINALLLLLAVFLIFSLSLVITDWSIDNAYFSIIDSASQISLSKTAIVVSLALGVAISPTIYTLIDDALFEVPEGVKQASFALGATQTQTLLKVVLVVALPSIISAVMLGFGRAFGETMIVLMVTGNTPIANWDLLSGLRTLTSNLAIELQEAQVDSTIYHILFFTAAVLFVFTFVINTIAAILKRRMHRDAE